MEQSLLAGVLTLSLVLLNPSSASSAQSSQITEVREVRDYTVNQGESLSSIAEREYGSVDFWTNIWIENPWIQNPDSIEKDWVIKLSKNEPERPATLSADLKAKLTKQFPQVEKSNMSGNETQALPSQSNYSGGVLNEAQMSFLGNCESGMTATRNSGNGYYGAFQFSYGTWQRMNTGYERADLAPLEVQKDAVQRLLSRSSIFTQFPGCARKMQNLGLL